MRDKLTDDYCPEPSVGEAEGDGDGDSSGELFLEGDGDASVFEVFFFAVEVELVPVDFFPVEVVDFLVVAAVECVVVVAAVSSLCAQDTTKAEPARTVINPRTNFFIVKGIWIRNAETVQFDAERQAINTGRTLDGIPGHKDGSICGEGARARPQ
jgi:hypothetical protein